MPKTDIDTWKTKKLESLVIPFKSLFIHERTDWHPSQPEIINAEINEVSIECGCGQEIKAVLNAVIPLAENAATWLTNNKQALIDGYIKNQGRRP